MRASSQANGSWSSMFPYIVDQVLLATRRRTKCSKYPWLRGGEQSAQSTLGYAERNKVFQVPLATRRITKCSKYPWLRGGEQSAPSTRGYAERNKVLQVPLATRRGTKCSKYPWLRGEEQSAPSTLGYAERNKVLQVPLATRRRTKCSKYPWLRGGEQSAPSTRGYAEENKVLQVPLATRRGTKCSKYLWLAKMRMTATAVCVSSYLSLNSAFLRKVCVYSNSRNDVPRVAQGYGTIAAQTRHRKSVLVVFVVFCVHMHSFAGLIRRAPPPTFSDTAITDRHSDTTFFQLRAHRVRISLSIGSEKSFEHVPPVGVELSTFCVQGEHPIH